MRPRGEIRVALGAAAAEFGSAGATWRDLAHSACVGFNVARETVKNMARGGELAVVGEVRVPGVCRPMLRYAPVVIGEPAESPGASLEAVVRCWADFR